MGKANVVLYVLASQVTPDLLEDFDRGECGSNLSTADRLVVNKTSEGYSVMFDAEEFRRLELSRLMATIVRTFATNLPGQGIDFSACYLYETTIHNLFDTEIGEKLLGLDEFCRQLSISGKVPGFEYSRTEGILEVVEELQDPEEEDDDDGEDDDEYPDDPLGFLDKSLVDYTRGDGKRKKRKDYYGTSRVLRNAKHPKRDIKRHGIIVASSKGDLKKDEKIIKSFLKDFIPGGADWKKDLRAELAERWINMYAVSKKTMERLNKQHRNAQRKKSSKTNGVQRALDMTNRLLNVPVDRWNDPSK